MKQANTENISDAFHSADPNTRKKKLKTKLDTEERNIKQILSAADLNPNYYHYFKTRKIDFNTLIELTAEDLIIIGITDEAERNALLSCTVMIRPNSHFTNSPAFDIQKTVQNTTSIVQRAHSDLTMMKRDLYKKIKHGFEHHSISNPFLELGHTSTSASLHFLKLIDQGLHIVENDYSMMLDSLDENKQGTECHSYQMVLYVASSVFLTAIIGGFLVKRFLW